MTPYQMAVAECANLIESECMLQRGPCVLAKGKERCGYFEQSVLPLGDLPELESYKSYHGAAEAYRGQRALRRHGKARLCACGEPLPKRARRCPTCAEKAAKERTKERVRRHRAEIAVVV